MLFRAGIRRLGSKERGFFYRYPDTGETVREGRVLRRIENLKVPPAWEDARIARSPSAKVQAIGFESGSGSSRSSQRRSPTTLKTTSKDDIDHVERVVG